MKIWTHNNFTIHEFEELDSTNSYAFEMANSRKIFDHEVILAARQTSGRGRQNRSWSSPNGNLYFSLVLQPEVEITKIPQISFVAVVALRLAIEKIFRDEGNDSNLLKNKWPNDLLIDEKKVAGILLESKISKQHSAKKGCEFVIVGTGVNLVSNPAATIFPATNLMNFGSKISPQDLLKKFLDEFEKIYENWLTFGFNKTRNIWLSGAFRLKEKITVRLDEKTLDGIFSDLDHEGNLLLSDNEKILKISAADVL